MHRAGVDSGVIDTAAVIGTRWAFGGKVVFGVFVKCVPAVLGAKKIEVPFVIALVRGGGGNLHPAYDVFGHFVLLTRG
jgi:hypothetical protein